MPHEQVLRSSRPHIPNPDGAGVPGRGQQRAVRREQYAIADTESSRKLARFNPRACVPKPDDLFLPTRRQQLLIPRPSYRTNTHCVPGNVLQALAASDVPKAIPSLPADASCLPSLEKATRAPASPCRNRTVPGRARAPSGSGSPYKSTLTRALASPDWPRAEGCAEKTSHALKRTRQDARHMADSGKCVRAKTQ